MTTSQRTGFGFICLVLLCIFALVRYTARIASGFAFGAGLRPLYGIAFTNPDARNVPCGDLDLAFSGQLSAGQRFAVGSLLNALKCPERAAQILPELTPANARSALLSYQWGLVAWERGDVVGAAALWRQGQGIDQRLLIEARQTRATDLNEAQSWYEAAIMSAGSPRMQAEAITAYTEDLRGSVPTEVSQARLAHLEAYSGSNTALGYRLSGQRAWLGGNYAVAVERYSRATALGFADAETWYWLGEAAWRSGDFQTTERALHMALNTPIQVAGRRPWHLNRLSALLISQERLEEALVFQEEAVCLNDYYLYADSLAVLYKQLGQPERAQAMCAQAAASNSAPATLRCQQP